MFFNGYPFGFGCGYPFPVNPNVATSNEYSLQTIVLLNTQKIDELEKKIAELQTTIENLGK